MTVSRPNLNFRTKQIVHSNAEARPYVGFEHLTEMPSGWEYNIKKWCSLFDLKLPTLPRLADASTQGIKESEYFLSGIGSLDHGDLYINKIKERFLLDERILYNPITGEPKTEYNSERQWIPEIRHGWYYRYKTPFFLYSDNSRIQYVDNLDNRDGRNYIKLDTEPSLDSPILAATFRRNPKTKTPDYYTKVTQVAEFSGIYNNTEELETVTSSGKILWDNIDITKKEFIIDTTIEGQTSLYFNRDLTNNIGVIPEYFQDLAACEVLGLSNGAPYQVYYLKYFPVLADDSFHLYIADDSTWEEWGRVDSWFDLINNNEYDFNKKYYVDRDLGIVYLGSAQNGGIPNIGRQIVATYTTTLRIEYEEDKGNINISAIDADVNPITQHLNQGFVVITHDQLEAASIILDIDKQKIPFTSNPAEYGPITTGTDYAVLRATVKSASGIAVPDVLVGFTMSPTGIGAIDGGAESSSITDGAGQAYSSYQPPVSADSLGFYSITVRPSTHTSYLTGYKEVIVNNFEAGLEGQEDNLYIYQVLKDDILLGYDNVDEWIDEQVSEGNISIPAWVDGDPDKELIWKSELIIKYNLKDWDGLQSDGTIEGRKVVVYKIGAPGSNEYDGDNWDPNAINPSPQDPESQDPVFPSGTIQYGAVVPLRPELIEKITDPLDIHVGKYRVIYPEDAIPDCDPNDSSNPIGGYWLISSRTIKFRAHCWSDYYNRTIYSNEITARISLPSYMLGEYLTTLLKKVPYGWRIPDDNLDAASGLDGATFITINPSGTYNDSDPWNQILWGPSRIFNVINGTISNSDEWASAPFQSVGFQFIKPED